MRFVPLLTCVFHQSNNFKDPGIQHYGGPLFQSLRDRADELFLSMPPPEKGQMHVDPELLAFLTDEEKIQMGLIPAPRGGHAAPAAPRVDMSRFHDQSRGCMAGSGWVSLADGHRCRLSELQRGDRVVSRTAAGASVLATVACLVHSRVGVAGTYLCSLPGSALLITPWHPVRLTPSGPWCFPAHVSGSRRVAVPAVYSVVLEDALVPMPTGGVSLRKLPGWSDGLVSLDAVEFVCKTPDACVSDLL